MQTEFRLIKRNRYYYIGYINTNGRRCWKTTKQTTQNEAIKVLRQFQSPSTKNDHPILLSDMLKEYLDNRGKLLRTRTLKDYILYLNEFIAIVGNKPLQQYSQTDVEKFRNTLRERGLKNTTINIRHRSIKAIFGYAVQYDYIAVSPFRHIKLISIPQRTPTFMTKEQFAEFSVNVDDRRMLDLYLVALLTGARLAEITNLRWDCVDFENEQITIRNTDSFTTKSGKQRTIPMHKEVIEILQRIKSNQSNSLYVFCKESGYKFSNSFVSHEFKRYCRLANLPNELHFHSLRHTFASWCVQSDVDIYVVKELLGHSTIKTTEIYSHISKSKLHHSVNQLQLS